MDIVWHKAKTFETTAPHEYILEHEYPELFARVRLAIEKDGVSEPFRIFRSIVWSRYVYTDYYRYWIIEDVLNRDSRYGLKQGIRPVKHEVDGRGTHPFCGACSTYFMTEKRKRLHACNTV